MACERKLPLTWKGGNEDRSIIHRCDGFLCIGDKGTIIDVTPPARMKQWPLEFDCVCPGYNNLREGLGVCALFVCVCAGGH